MGRWIAEAQTIHDRHIITAVRYVIARYGFISSVPGVRAVRSGGSYVGY